MFRIYKDIICSINDKILGKNVSFKTAFRVYPRLKVPLEIWSRKLKTRSLSTFVTVTAISTLALRGRKIKSNKHKCKHTFCLSRPLYQDKTCLRCHHSNPNAAAQFATNILGVFWPFYFCRDLYITPHFKARQKFHVLIC